MDEDDLGGVPEVRVQGRRRASGDLASALVATASGLVAARGQADFSLREVAELVGVSHTAAYRHFAAKADLLAEIAVRGFSMLDRAIAAAVVRREGVIDAVASLEVALRAHIGFAERQPGAYRVMFLAEFADATRHPEPARMAAIVVGRLCELIEAGQGAGVVRADRPAATLAAVLWAAAHGHAGLLLDGRLAELRGAAGLAADRRLLVETLLRGLAP